MLYVNDFCTDAYWNLAAEEYLLKNFLFSDYGAMKIQ